MRRPVVFQGAVTMPLTGGMLTGPCPKGGNHVWAVFASSGVCNKCGKYQQEWRDDEKVRNANRKAVPERQQPEAAPPQNSEVPLPNADTSYRYAPPRVDGRLEANRGAAEQALDHARAASSRGDDAEALRLVLKSLRLYETHEGHALQEQLRARPAFSDSSDQDEQVESAAKRSVQRILLAHGDHSAVLDLPPSATAAQIRKAYKHLSLQVHPDRNDAEGAEEAFKMLKESFGVLIDRAEQETVGDVFRRYAQGESGLVGFDELRAALAGLRRNDLVPLDSPTARQLLTNLEQAHPDGVSVADFRALVKALRVGSVPPAHTACQTTTAYAPAPPGVVPAVVTVGGVFRRLDPMNTGFISVHLLSDALHELDIDRDRSEAAEDELDEDGVQQMTMADFRAFVKSLRS